MSREKLTALRRHVELGVTALALAAIDAELAVPEVREWRVVDDSGRYCELIFSSEARARHFVTEITPSFSVKASLSSRIAATKAGEWEPAQ